MNVADILNDIEQVAAADGLPEKDRFILLSWLSAELNELSGKADFDWNLIYLDPAIVTVVGQFNYILPEGFGSNFSRFAGDDGDSYACKLTDGSSQSLLDYESPKQFFSHNAVNITNTRPSSYTIMTTSSGRKELWLYPGPDANGTVGYYLVGGLYPKTDWKLEELEGLPGIPGNCAALKYGVLRRLNRTVYEPMYQEALSRLMMAEAQNKRGQLMPVMNQGGQRTHYDVYGGRSM